MTVTLDRIDIDRVVAEAHRARNEAMGRLLAAGARKLFAGLRTLVEPILQWRERAALQSELGGMTDAELSDIGLTRCDIGQVVDGSFRDERGKPSRRLRLVSLSGIRRVHADIIKVDPQKAA